MPGPGKELRLSDSDLKLSREQRQFPFRRPARDQLPPDAYAREIAAVDEATVEVLRSVDDMIHRAVKKKLGPHLRGLDLDIMVARCTEHIMCVSLPRYDADHTPRTKVSTFVYDCARNFCSQEKRLLLRAKRSKRKSDKKMLMVDATIMSEGNVAKEEFHDRAIEHAASYVMRYPERYFTDPQAKVFRALLGAERGKNKRDLAKELDYMRASSLSMMIRRIKDRISEIDIESFSMEPDECP